MTTVTLNIKPSFHYPCSFTLTGENNDYTLIIETSSKNPTKFETYIKSSIDIITIQNLAKKITDEALTDDRIILDGVTVCCIFSENGLEKNHIFRCPEFGSNELKLVEAFFKIIEQYVTNQEIINHIELLEGYFTNKLLLKTFNETPLRLRFYGSISVHEMNELTQVINSVLNKDEIVIDMTNSSGMGTILYSCFEPLKKIKKLSFIANSFAAIQIEEMGFDKNFITIID